MVARSSTVLLLVGLTSWIAPLPSAATEPLHPGVERRAARPARHARSTYTWPFATGPYYGDVPAESERQAGVLRTVVGSFDLLRGDLDRLLPAELRTTNRLERSPAQYFIVCLDGKSSEAGGVREAIEAVGGAVVGDLPVAAHVARLTRKGFETIRTSPGVLAIVPYHPALKLDPAIGRVPLQDPNKALSPIYTLDVRLFPGESPEAAAAQLRSLGATVRTTYPDTVVIDVRACTRRRRPCST